MEKLERAVGNFVTGDKFWDRENEIQLFTELLDEGAHILMAAPRRIGKTSLIREVALRIDKRYYCLQVDLQKSESPADAIAELGKATRPYEKLWNKTKGIFQNILSKVTENIESIGIDDLTVTLRSGMTSGDWRSKGDQLFSSLSETDKPVVVFFDELPILINRILKGREYKITPEKKKATDLFMSWIRDISIRYNKKIRLVITGSIGIEPALRQADLSATLNTFTPFILPPWDIPTTIECLQALANRYKVCFQENAIELIVERLGYLIPHHVQMFFDNIYTDCMLKSNMEVTQERVDEIYNTKMLGIQGHAELSHMEERLKTAFGMDIYPLALEIVTETAATGSLDSKRAMRISDSYRIENPSSKDILRDILEVLQHDGYVKKEGRSFVFVSNLLRDWWKAHFEFGYTPVSERRA